MVLLGMQSRITEYNQENLRIETLEGGPPGKTTSLIRSFPSKVGVRVWDTNPRIPFSHAAGRSHRIRPTRSIRINKIAIEKKLSYILLLGQVARCTSPPLKPSSGPRPAEPPTQTQRHTPLRELGPPL